MGETSALVELLERKGILTRQDVLAMIRELRQREPTAIPPRRFHTSVPRRSITKTHTSFV